MNNIIYSDVICINNKLENVVASWSFMVTDENNYVIHASTGRVAGTQNNNRVELLSFINELQYVLNKRNVEFTMYVL